MSEKFSSGTKNSKQTNKQKYWTQVLKPNVVFTLYTDTIDATDLYTYKNIYKYIIDKTYKLYIYHNFISDLYKVNDMK